MQAKAHLIDSTYHQIADQYLIHRVRHPLARLCIVFGWYAKPALPGCLVYAWIAACQMLCWHLIHSARIAGLQGV